MAFDLDGEAVAQIGGDVYDRWTAEPDTTTRDDEGIVHYLRRRS